jgi:hypothetical protein
LVVREKDREEGARVMDTVSFTSVSYRVVTLTEIPESASPEGDMDTEEAAGKEDEEDCSPMPPERASRGGAPEEEQAPDKSEPATQPRRVSMRPVEEEMRRAAYWLERQFESESNWREGVGRQSVLEVGRAVDWAMERRRTRRRVRRRGGGDGGGRGHVGPGECRAGG